MVRWQRDEPDEGAEAAHHVQLPRVETLPNARQKYMYFTVLIFYQRHFLTVGSCSFSRVESGSALTPPGSANWPSRLPPSSDVRPMTDRILTPMKVGLHRISGFFISGIRLFYIWISD